MPKKYDVVIIGGGAGGITLAKTARGFGKKVVIVEINKLGGECTWTGCVPSKALIKSAQVCYYAKQGKKYGLDISNIIDTKGVMDHVRSDIKLVYSTHTPEVLKKQGIDTIFGLPEFIDNHNVQVNNEVINFTTGFVATGSRPFVPPIEGLQKVSYFTNENIFNIEKLPQSMIILGGGPIGAEMASALNRLGVQITLIEMNDRILPKEDEELVGILTDQFKKEGITLATRMRATKVKKQNETIEVTVIGKNNEEKIIKAETLLVAVGRRPNIEGLTLEKAGIQTTKTGIVTDTTLKTSVKNIYACGDVVGPYLFSHMAWKQAVIAVRNAFVPLFKQHIDYKNVIWVTFTAPQLATAGLTERAAREKFGSKISIYKKPYKELDRAMADNQECGLGKFICDKKGKLIGIHILGTNAGDIIHEAQLAKTYGIPFADIQPVIHAYPTYSELIWWASKKAYIDRLNKKFFIKVLKRLFLKRE